MRSILPQKPCLVQGTKLLSPPRRCWRTLLRQKHRISGFGQPVRPAEALGRQGTASWPVVPSLTPLPFFPLTICFRVMCRFNVPGHVRGLYCGIGCTFEPLAAERRRLLGSPLLRRLTALPPRQQDRAGEPADRSRDMLKLVRPCRPSLASSVVKGVKERNILEVRGHRFGLGQLLRGRVRPMAGDSPSGERLAGQSGLVFDVEAHPASLG